MNAPIPSRRDAVVQLVAQGWSDREMARLWKISRNTVRRWRIELGLGPAHRAPKTELMGYMCDTNSRYLDDGSFTRRVRGLGLRKDCFR